MNKIICIFPLILVISRELDPSLGFAYTANLFLTAVAECHVIYCEGVYETT